jgi:hypothetical protein
MTTHRARTTGRITIPITPALRRALESAAAEEGTIVERLAHRILCARLGRFDLMNDPPATRGARIRRGGPATTKG